MTGSPQRRLPLNSVRNRLVLLFFAITASAVGFVYLYVVPQLRSSLTAEKLDRLETAATDEVQQLSRLLEGATQEEITRRVTRIGQLAEARLTLLAVEDGSPSFVIADSAGGVDALAPRYPAATAAAETGEIASGVEQVGGERFGETAVAFSRDGEVPWVAVLSTPLDDVDDNVGLIRRQILIAGAIGILAALAAGYFAALAHSRRLRRLEAAAERVAEGDFGVQIPIDGSDEVGQLARTFEEMAKRLERLDSARREFIANASHELRTPIFSLGGFVELLEDEDPDPAARAEFVRTMREQVDRLTKLATDLLDLSKLDSDALDLRAESVDLIRSAEQAIREFGPAAERHDSEITLRQEAPGGAYALADPDRVAQILRILLDNALTHTPEGTAITMTINWQAGSPRITVADDGPGIDARDRERVFERFFTADSVGGSGLGLAIAYELATRMNGRLRLMTQRGRTAFELTLPAARALAPRRQPA